MSNGDSTDLPGWKLTGDPVASCAAAAACIDLRSRPIKRRPLLSYKQWLQLIYSDFEF